MVMLRRSPMPISLRMNWNLIGCTRRRRGPGRAPVSRPPTRMTRLRIWSTISSSWVAMTIVVPVRLIRSSSRMMPTLVVGSRLPVGSSASRIAGRFTKARAIATRCCSPPDSSCGKRCSLPPRPTSSSTSGTVCAIACRGLPITCSANATFSNTVLFGSSRKSWNTTPIWRRSAGTFQLASRATSLPATCTRPLVARSSRSTRRRKVDLPDPDDPTRKTNSPLATSRLTSSSAARGLASTELGPLAPPRATRDPGRDPS